MNTSQKNRIYKVLIAAVLVLSCIAFSPLVIPYGVYKPTFLSMPYTLWTGLLVALLFVLLTYLATRVHPGKEEEKS